jgi:transposase
MGTATIGSSEACMLAGLAHSTAVSVPDAEHEVLRDLVRAREAAKKDGLRAKHRLGKFLLRHGRRPPTGVRPLSGPTVLRH